METVVMIETQTGMDGMPSIPADTFRPPTPDQDAAEAGPRLVRPPLEDTRSSEMGDRVLAMIADSSRIT